MAKPDDMPVPRSASGSDYVAVVVARSVEHAGAFRVLLEDHDIPSILGTEEDRAQANGAPVGESESAMTSGVPVLVPEGLLDEASEIIADREDFDELDEENDFDDEGEEHFSLDDNMTEDIGPLFDEDEDDD